MSISEMIKLINIKTTKELLFKVIRSMTIFWDQNEDIMSTEIKHIYEEYIP